MDYGSLRCLYTFSHTYIILYTTIQYAYNPINPSDNTSNDRLLWFRYLLRYLLIYM